MMWLSTVLSLIEKLRLFCTRTMFMLTHLLTSKHFNAVILLTRHVLYRLTLNESRVNKPPPTPYKKWRRERESGSAISLAVSSTPKLYNTTWESVLMNPLAKIFMRDVCWKQIPHPKSYYFNGNMSKQVCCHQICV